MEIVKYTVVIIEQKPDAYLVKCGFCKGSGIKPGYSETPCPVCGGVGKVWLKVPKDWDCDIGILKCGFCKGTGIKPGYSETRCPICKGVGALVKCFPRVTCSMCRGSGIKPGYSETPCPVCEGVGSIWVENLKTY